MSKSRSDASRVTRHASRVARTPTAGGIMTALFRGLPACAAVALATSALATPAPAQPPATSSTQPAPSGTGVVTGRVLDRGSQQPLAGAQVVLVGTTRGT